MFKPNLSILPQPQRQLWAELRDTPSMFVLYGGTALALRLGHRQSEDFDFFSNTPFRPNSLRDSVPYLKQAEMTQFQATHSRQLWIAMAVKLSFFGSLGIKRVQDPDIVEENGVKIASMLDLLASKLKTVQLRAQAKDYRDVLGTLDAGLSLAEGLAAAAAIYGKDFNGALSLKALTFFEDGDLPSLTRTVQKRLMEAATSVNLRELPAVVARSGLSRRESEP